MDRRIHTIPISLSFAMPPNYRTGRTRTKIRGKKKQLFVILGYLTTVEGEYQNKHALLRSFSLFEDLGILSGLEPSLQSRHVFRYITRQRCEF